MAAIVHFSKQDATQRLGAAGGTTAAEVTEYTVSWADLTGAGFANGDDVIVFIKATINVNNASNNVESTFGRGSTFADRTVLQTDRTESGSADATLGAREICFLDRLTLATDNNFYTSIRIIATSTPSLDDYCFFIMKLDDLAADDFRYADTTPTGNAPATVTDGASVTLPASGGDDWLVLGNVRWETDNASDKMISQLSLGGDVRMINSTEGEDPSEQVGRPLIGYLAAAANSAVCLTQYYNVNGSPSPNAVTRTAIFALRMEAFANHAGNMDQDAIAMGGVLNTYVATNTVSLELSATGPVAWFAQTIADVGAGAQGPYHRVQLDGTDIVAGLGRASGWSYDPSDELPLTQFGTISMTSGTKVIDVDCANELKTNAFNFDEHTLVAFSMELAAGVASTVEADIAAPGANVSATVDVIEELSASVQSPGSTLAALVQNLIDAEAALVAGESIIAANADSIIDVAANADSPVSIVSASAEHVAVDVSAASDSAAPVVASDIDVNNDAAVAANAGSSSAASDVETIIDASVDSSAPAAQSAALIDADAQASAAISAAVLQIASAVSPENDASIAANAGSSNIASDVESSIDASAAMTPAAAQSTASIGSEGEAFATINSPAATVSADTTVDSDVSVVALAGESVVAANLQSANDVLAALSANASFISAEISVFLELSATLTIDGATISATVSSTPSAAASITSPAPIINATATSTIDASAVIDSPSAVVNATLESIAIAFATALAPSAEISALLAADDSVIVQMDVASIDSSAFVDQLTADIEVNATSSAMELDATIASLIEALAAAHAAPVSIVGTVSLQGELSVERFAIDGYLLTNHANGYLLTARHNGYLLTARHNGYLRGGS